MIIRTGCDIAEIKRFSKLEGKVISRIFFNGECRNKKPQTLAGIFAAKESCRKVFNDLGWLDVEIKNEKGGKPYAKFHKKKSMISCDLSISHDGNYAIAVFVALLEKT